MNQNFENVSELGVVNSYYYNNQIYLSIGMFYYL